MIENNDIKVPDETTTKMPEESINFTMPEGGIGFDMEQVVSNAPNVPVAKEASIKHKLLNICVFAFVVVLTGASLATFFIAITGDDIGAAYSIASIYILCMLLGAPTLKVFLDKVACPVMKKLNIVGLVSVFLAILAVTFTVCIMFVL